MGDRRRTSLALIALTALCALAPSAHAAVSSSELALVKEVNNARARNGLAPLRSSSELARSARRYSRWQMRNGYFGHQPQIRMSSNFSLRAEVLRIASGRRLNVRRTVRLWLQSPSHRAAIFNRSMRQAGAGIVAGRFRGRSSLIVTMHLGAR